ncbi:hypothetical protein KFE98_03275 [bacterium SCSIO 12741]|nr:hypothetical protein KFE98_03275 [bacterium SCSIO 12741]
MGITIHKILDQKDQFAYAELTHGTERFKAHVWNEKEDLEKQIGIENLLVELNYDRLLSLKLIEGFQDKDSYIRRIDQHYQIRGRVIQIMKTETDTLIDIYLQTGPDFISILQSQIGNLNLDKEQGVELEITELKFFPSHY